MNRFLSKLLPLAALLIVPMMAQAQDTSSAMRGRVLDDAGAPVAGAAVVIQDMRTGSQRRLQSNAAGTFLATNLAVGGPYRVTVNGTRTVEVASISLGETYNLSVTVGEAIEEIIAIGQQAQAFETTPGPTATFGQYELDSAVAFNRDIKDVYAIDPRLNLDGFEINCAGKHPRFNNITLDGVSHQDRFGLNTNGYSTATGMPFPYDAIQQVSVELAPFDVKYGGFSACNINAVTKSGSNEWEANVFYEYTTDSLREDELDDLDLSGESYRETKQGFSVGGPIIKDKLFFFVAYEEQEEPRFLAAGYNGSGNGEERPWLSQTDYERVLNIAQNIYGFDPGGQGQDGAQTAENIFVRLDWDINDNHNLAAIYNDYDGVQSRSSDSDAFEFEFSNHFYDKGSVSETYTLILDSQWNDALSTQLYFTDTRMDDSQVTVGPKDIGDHQINVNGFSNVIYLGADDSRQANKLFTDSQLLKLSGQYLVGDHVISAGIETEELEVFNIFVQHSRGGEWDYRDNSAGDDPNCAALTAQQRFDGTVVADSDGDITNDTCGASGIDHFELGRPYRVYYGSGGGTNDPNDAAANFVNTQNALFVQDEIYFAEQDFTLTAGLRYEWIDSSDSPTYNSTLSNAIGIRNDSGLDGVDILMPRIGFTWGYRDDLTLRGGLGLYSGGNPNVWLGNAWSRDGITNVQVRNDYFHNLSIFDGGIPLVSGAPIGGAVPQDLVDQVAAVSGDEGSFFFNNLIDPNYEAPREWKTAIGATWDMPWGGITADIDFMYTRLEKQAIYVDVSQEYIPGNDTLAGAPIYTAIPGAGEGNLMLTNANADGSGTVFSAVFKKDFDWGLDLMLGYARTDVEDAAPMTSFTGESSFENLATNDINNPRAATGNYNVKSRVTVRASFARDFWGDNATRFTLMGYYQTGQPSTYTMFSEDSLQVGESFRHLLYVPDGPSDPNVIFDDEFDQTAFFDWVSERGLKGGKFVRRNSETSKVNSRVDLRIDQEIPLFMDDLKARAFLKIYNFTNMLNDEWGRQYDAEFFSQDVVDVSLDDSGAYIFEEFNRKGVTDLQEFPSLWEMRLGLEVNFR
ncbi:MAG: carboxypeptidase regulatory-like domain-containing protein [Gammaproteobacteria bacterium]|nr:carboxypeptidase regulatory-like domain-containing protein [Gammaproteobacteria bacterium]MDH3429138.1 carboxypeptidase regulatory-like domain-containing protein [Gammaproteobacteria bacterium]